MGFTMSLPSYRVHRWRKMDIIEGEGHRFVPKAQPSFLMFAMRNFFL